MQQIINFIVRNKNFLLFLLLFGFSVGVTIQSNIYHRSTFINSANWVTGGVYSSVADVSDYFSLKEYNQRLLEENTTLHNQVFNFKQQNNDTLITDTTNVLNRYTVRKARVYKNSYGATKNYLLINRGKKDSITQDMGVITSKGIVGIVERTSGKYAAVQSILNTSSRINASLKNTSHFGTLSWDGKNYASIQLNAIPRQAPVKKGDTIITGGMSSIFPKGILIGRVIDYHFTESGNEYIINVAPFNDMSNIGYVYVLENKDKSEIDNLQEGLPHE